MARGRGRTDRLDAKSNMYAAQYLTSTNKMQIIAYITKRTMLITLPAKWRAQLNRRRQQSGVPAHRADTQTRLPADDVGQSDLTCARSSCLSDGELCDKMCMTVCVCVCVLLYKYLLSHRCECQFVPERFCVQCVTWLRLSNCNAGAWVRMFVLFYDDVH